MDVRASRRRGSQLHDEIVDGQRFAGVDIAVGKELRSIGLTFSADLRLALLEPEASLD